MSAIVIIICEAGVGVLALLPVKLSGQRQQVRGGHICSQSCIGSVTQSDSCLDMQPRYTLSCLHIWPDSKEHGTEAPTYDLSALVPVDT